MDYKWIRVYVVTKKETNDSSKAYKVIFTTVVSKDDVFCNLGGWEKEVILKPGRYRFNISKSLDGLIAGTTTTI